MKCPKCGHKFTNPEKVKGGKKGKRAITPGQQAVMQLARRSVKIRLFGTAYCEVSEYEC